VIAGMFNFEAKPYFEAETESRENVRVDFGQGNSQAQPPQ
jgi:hypothetical protein